MVILKYPYLPRTRSWRGHTNYFCPPKVYQLISSTFDKMKTNPSPSHSSAPESWDDKEIVFYRRTCQLRSTHLERYSRRLNHDVSTVTIVAFVMVLRVQTVGTVVVSSCIGAYISGHLNCSRNVASSDELRCWDVDKLEGSGSDGKHEDMSKHRFVTKPPSLQAKRDVVNVVAYENVPKLKLWHQPTSCGRPNANMCIRALREKELM